MGPPVGQALEFLSQVLSQRGPQAVPYTENVKWTIREHMSDLLKMFPTLTISASEFHTNDGRVLNLLKAQGTVPIHFQGVKYNIPVIIWLPERYPMHAPLVYVTPTPNMVIKQNHSCVDASGQVHTPYITRWLHPSSDLSAMTQEMCMVFGAEPPLYSKPAGYTPPPAAGPQHMQQNLAQAMQQQPSQQQYPSYGQPAAGGSQQQQYPPPPSADMAWGAAYNAGSMGAVSASSGSMSAAYPGAAGGSVTATGSGSPQRPARPDAAAGSGGARDLEEAFAGLAVRALAARLQGGLEAFNRDAAREMDALLDVQRQLAAREQELQRAVGSVQQERAGTEGVVAELGAKCRALEQWLDDNEWKAAALASSSPSRRPTKASSAAVPDADAAADLLAKLDVNKLVVPADDLCRQALSAQAEDLAVEDALTVLDKALQAGKVPVDAYIKQFFSRARGLKIAQMQATALRASRGRAAPAATPGHPLVQGDGWSGPSVSVAHAAATQQRRV